MKRKLRQFFASIGGLLCISPVWAMLFYAGTLPDSYYVHRGESLSVPTMLPITAQAEDAASEVSLRLFGILPIKTAEIQPMDEIRLVPCGQPFGIRMLMDGIMVIGFGEVHTPDGQRCPAVSAGIQEGDIIRSVNGNPLASTEDFRNASALGESMCLEVQRNGETLEITVTPVYSVQEECYKTGLWVRDSTAGIGTITYYEPETGCFGGLGHPICDPDTGGLIPLASGEADAVTISGARKGKCGAAGQLQGYFSANAPIGTLCCNDECGIFGTLYEAPSDGEAIPLGFRQEVVLGEATILSTVCGSTPEAYTIEITAIDYTDDTQNMVIEVTDEELIAATGGIVQGMSGSPIIQNGMLVGAVTHVFVSEPTQGYGIFAESMYAVSQSTAQMKMAE